LAEQFGLSSDAPEAALQTLVTGATLDSRDVRRGDLYLALPGARRHGAEFAAQVEAQGASAILTDEAGAALAEAAGDGFGLDGVTLEVTDPEPLLERARKAAFADAHHRAAQYARLAGRRLGAVTEVTETVAPGAPLPRPKLFARDAAAAMPVEPGESTTTASVVVRFALEDA